MTVLEFCQLQQYPYHVYFLLAAERSTATASSTEPCIALFSQIDDLANAGFLLFIFQCLNVFSCIPPLLLSKIESLLTNLFDRLTTLVSIGVTLLQ